MLWMKFVSTFDAKVRILNMARAEIIAPLLDEDGKEVGSTIFFSGDAGGVSVNETISQIGDRPEWRAAHDRH